MNYAILLWMSIRRINNGKIKNYQKKLQDPAFRAEIESSSKTTLNEVLPFSAKLSVYLFLLALVTIVAIAIFPEVRTIGAGKPIQQATTTPIKPGAIKEWLK